MAQEFSFVKLSGGTDGKNIKVAATATAGTLIHTAHATAIDKVELWAMNTSAAPVKLTIEWGEATAPDGNIESTIPAESGPICVVPKFPLTNSLTVRAFAGSANVIVINGGVDRITG